MSFLGGMEKKPEATKSQYAFWGACIVTGLIGVVWVSTLPARFATVNEGVVTEEIEAEEEVSSLKDFFADTKDQFGAVMESINGGIKEDTAEVVIPPDSALGALQADAEPVFASTTPLNQESPVTDEASSTREVSPLPNPSVSTSAPRVVRIATTTKEKSE